MDAVFRHFESGEVRIAAILSERESVDEELNAKAARRIWATLVERGWTRVAQGRRTLHQIRVALMDAE